MLLSIPLRSLRYTYHLFYKEIFTISEDRFSGHLDLKNGENKENFEVQCGIFFFNKKHIQYN